MKTNESGLDRVIRVVVGIVLLVLFFAHTLSGALGIIALILGAILVITGLSGYCLLYTIFKVKTKK